jgi:C1A family cysteine protease
MLIIGYDDSLGAIRLQNSQGTEWGSGGYVWIAYTTFQTLAQGTALYVPD